MDEPNNHHAEDGEEEMRMDIDNDNVQIDNQLQLNALPHFEFEQMNLEEQPDLLLNPAEMPMSLDVDEPNNDIDGNYPHNPAANPLAEPAVIPNVLPAPRPMRCKTKKYVATFRWEWDENAALCGICRNLLVLRCMDCDMHSRDHADCTEAQGACNHVFHQHCIAKWLETQGIDTCPLDTTRWIYIRRTDR